MEQPLPRTRAAPLHDSIMKPSAIVLPGDPSVAAAASSAGGYPVYVTSGYETGAEVDGYPAETEAPAVSAPVYAPPTLYPAKYYYSPSPGVYFYRPAFERPRKCNCG